MNTYTEFEDIPSRCPWDIVFTRTGQMDNSLVAKTVHLSKSHFSIWTLASNYLSRQASPSYLGQHFVSWPLAGGSVSQSGSCMSVLLSRGWCRKVTFSPAEHPVEQEAVVPPASRPPGDWREWWGVPEYRTKCVHLFLCSEIMCVN